MSDLPAGADRRAVRAFMGELAAHYRSSMVTLMVDVGRRSGLFEAAARLPGPFTSADLAAEAACAERPVREWLGAMATGGVMTYEGGADGADRYGFPLAHAACLTGESTWNLAEVASSTAVLGRHVEDAAAAMRTGAGVPYERYRPHFTEMMDATSRRRFDLLLVDGYLGCAPGVTERLRAGGRVADLGCGTGHAVNVMAATFPAAECVGFDLATDAIERAAAEAAAAGLGNARFEVIDARTVPADPPWDLVCAFDAIHDVPDPAGVLTHARRMLTPDGVFLMVDVAAGSGVAANLDHPMGPYVYGTSVLHCLQVSLAAGGPGLGTAWGEQLARQMLADAGFTSVVVTDIPADRTNLIYVCRP